MALITLRDITLAFGSDPLLDRVSLEVAAGERVCLLGQNGAGKTTLLKVIAGRLDPESGEVLRDPRTRIAELPQAVTGGLEGCVREVVAGGLARLVALVERHRELSEAAADGGGLDELEAVQHEIEAGDGWDVGARVERTLTHLGLDADAAFEELSGGMQRRVLLGRALVAAPDLLLLDEPTNHLDIDAIEWLEELVEGWRGGVLFTTHDRRLLERVATRIVEIDRGTLTSWPGDYANYLRRREERLAAEAAANERFDRRLAEEEIWIRQGIKARRTRNEGRVRRLEAMRRERAERRALTGRARFAVQGGQSSGKRVIEARDASFGYGGSPIVENLSVLVERGDRIGLIGPNGSGKTTLLRLLLGELVPTAGEIVPGTRLEVAYFDQHRARLDSTARVRDCIADGSDNVIVDGKPRHVISWLQDFLFAPDRARQPVSALSGGERARLLLARLFAQPSNLLVMDEPTNDLDIETLELLEERLAEYSGTLLLVSHDRAFLDNVVTSTLVLEGGGRVGEYVGGYADWLRQRAAEQTVAAAPARPAEPAPRSAEPAARPAEPAARPAPRRLGYREQRELETLPGHIESLESRIAAVNERLADPALYREAGEKVAALRDELGALEAALGEAYARWEALDGAAQGA